MENLFNEDKIQEECGVFGVSLNVDEAAGVVYNGLLSLQHRGQEAAGIASIADNNIRCHKDLGLVTEIFSGTIPKLSKSRVAIGHTRYASKGTNLKENAGPFVREYLTGRIVVAQNGNIQNAAELKEKLKAKGLYFKGTSGTEVIAALVASEINAVAKGNPTAGIDALAAGITKACEQLEGAFSLAIACGHGVLIAVRDPIGFRPLCIGKSKLGIAISSESAALEAAGFDLDSAVAPGEIVIIKDAKVVKRETVLFPGEVHHCRGCAKAATCKAMGLCSFEYVYFARPDSIIDGLEVYKARHRMGRTLAKESPVDADYVVGVPDSGLPAAHGYASGSGIPLTAGFVKNRYVGRSFIYPTQEQRESIVRVKLNPLKSSINGKKIILVDDSIVRGTTISRIVKTLKKVGAKEVHVRISSPPFLNTCNYGTSVDKDKDSLIARQYTPEEICKQIGADSLAFISIPGLLDACRDATTNLCTSCFHR